MVSVGLNLLIYAFGALILLHLGVWAAVWYLLLAAWLEFRAMRLHCVDCAYYGLPCAFGKGWLAARLFNWGDPARFDARDITWRSFVSDFLIYLVPFAGAMLLLYRGFTWTIAALLAALTILFFAGTAAVRGVIACPHCRQRVMGCPAERLFGSDQAKRQ